MMTNIERLNNLSYENRSKELETYSIETLESMAIAIYEESLSIRDEHIELLRAILFDRFHKLNHAFVWNNENKQKFLVINDKCTQAFESAYNEAGSAASELENRIKNKDKFLTDYGIEINITPYMNDKFYDDDAGSSFGFVLSEPKSGFHPINYSFGHSSYDNEFKGKPLYLDKTENWNHEYFGDIFKDDYICYGIHILLENMWSFSDILNLEKMWANVEVTHQNFSSLSFHD